MKAFCAVCRGNHKREDAHIWPDSAPVGLPEPGWRDKPLGQRTAPLPKVTPAVTQPVTPLPSVTQPGNADLVRRVEALEAKVAMLAAGTPGLKTPRLTPAEKQRAYRQRKGKP